MTLKYNISNPCVEAAVKPMIPMVLCILYFTLIIFIPVRNEDKINK